MDKAMYIGVGVARRIARDEVANERGEAKAVDDRGHGHTWALVTSCPACFLAPPAPRRRQPEFAG